MSNEFAVDTPLPSTGLSQVERVVDTFIAPSKTFTDILRDASWWLPLLLMIVFSLASAYTVQKQVGFDRVQENQIHLSPKTEDQLNQLPPDQRAARMAMGAKITGAITYAIPIILVITLGIYSLILWGCFNFLLGAKTTFWQVMAVSFYASLPYLITNLLLIITLHFGGNAEAYDYKNPVGTNLAYYMPDASPVVKALLGVFDVVKLWSLVLEILGMAIIARKTIAQSAMVVLVLWFLGALIAVVPAAFS